jgi:hypothetical protein
MKTKIMLYTFLLSIFISFTSCDTGEYYKTFDYKTMTFVKPTTKEKICVRKISQTDDKIEMEVIFDVYKIKRTFIKKEGYWYSKYKYETVDVPNVADSFGDKFEIEYYIYPTHVVYKDDTFVGFIDLLKEKRSLYYDVKTNDLKNLDLNTVHNKLYYISDFYTMDGILYERKKHYEKGKYDGDIISEVGEYYANLDIFYWLDFEIYTPGAGVEPIYD